MPLFRRDHAGLVALREKTKEALKGKQITKTQAILLRLAMMFSTQRVIDSLEEAKEVEIESGDNPITGDWTPEDWAKLINEIFAALIENLPTLLAMCAAV